MKWKGWGGKLRILTASETPSNLPQAPRLYAMSLSHGEKLWQHDALSLLKHSIPGIFIPHGSVIDHFKTNQLLCGTSPRMQGWESRQVLSMTTYKCQVCWSGKMRTLIGQCWWTSLGRTLHVKRVPWDRGSSSLSLPKYENRKFASALMSRQSIPGWAAFGRA